MEVGGTRKKGKILLDVWPVLPLEDVQMGRKWKKYFS